MDGDRCKRNKCNGIIEDSYCNVCGLAEINTSLNENITKQTQQNTKSASITTGTGSSPHTDRSKSSRGSQSGGKSNRKHLGAGLVSVPELPSTEPEKAIMAEAKVPDNKRFCANCNNRLNREKGFCPKCGQKYSFIPSLKPNDLVGGQYEVKGALAYGGLGWIYLGFDRVLSRYVVLKGLLNTEDAASAAVAVAERQFLASVKHANIVGIYNFVNYGSEGFIVMEYVGGKTLKEIRQQRGALPVDEAISYIHRILSAFAYLHSLGLVYCDFKPDNVILEDNDVKLIDLGGVRRVDDPDGDIYGTVGYSAPEAGEGPTVASDLFTIGRTLAVLLTNIKGFTKEHLYTLPTPQEEPLFAEQESLYRFLLKSTAKNPDDRFQSADEMADQLLGVLREIVAQQTNTPHPSGSNLFGGDMLTLTNNIDFQPIKADYQQLPILMLDATDIAFNAVLNAGAIPDISKRAASLRQVVKQFPSSQEALLRLLNTLIEIGNYNEAQKALAQFEKKHPQDWRLWWCKGRSFMAQEKANEAQEAFDKVYSYLPGELAPKLALGLAAEKAGNFQLAIRMYNIVSGTDPSYTSAAFGLARCLCAIGDRNKAVAALERIPQSSNLYTRSRVEIARTLIDSSSSAPGAKELKEASMAIEALTLNSLDRYQLTIQILETALHLVTSQALSPTSSISILGQPFEELHLRKGLEKVLRDMARLSTGMEKILMVDQANRVRPRTWV
ncbi:serine/threonine-protein kinase PknG [Aetokthonos hydrillicola Thurmond2011]|jgi:serine/threonine-protein kinase PknG|uniref:Serine/threonine-protein kinase PknG n=1 Tax=Aetokthonos hydrillicola Thurmond2011 TaxID=2712845 RepID=A0AAP5I0V1_9CYAN|nr:serine/threonine-protein kinase [Aetokthonos hydrillicola]MBO3460519.1 tetratricopeptide repeat protein [Aetokthonos hydrillicola CCALA 1050]MBW4588193.1 tetratricopeptide repeat protein [Aetokthonos hydrillicola CCALA 1050]MDR9893123.1 serine/threonine-protein kinase PknG [Aetokthonos hydrillicola Thurmond2011]